MVVPLAEVLFVEMTKRFVELVGALALVVSVAVYSAQEVVIEGMVARGIDRAGGRFQIDGQRSGESGGGLGVELDAVRSRRRDRHAKVARIRNTGAGRGGHARGDRQLARLR